MLFDNSFGMKEKLWYNKQTVFKWDAPEDDGVGPRRLVSAGFGRRAVSGRTREETMIILQTYLGWGHEAQYPADW